MAKNKKKNSFRVDTGEMTLTFTNNHGESFASLRLNPTNPVFLARCKNMAEFFANPKRYASAEEFETEMEQKFCEFLGYDCKDSLFGKVGATAVMSDGRMFMFHVVDSLIQYVGPELRRRKAENLAKYVAKYRK